MQPLYYMALFYLPLHFTLPFFLYFLFLFSPVRANAHEIHIPPGSKTPTTLTQKHSSSSFLIAQTNYYSKAQEYFKVRKRPIHHFLDIGIGCTPIHSFYPFEFTAYPFSVYLNYRREKWGSLKIPIIFSFQYKYLLSENISLNQIHTLIGVRYPTSHDLRLFHVDFLTGFSLPTSFDIEKIALEMRLLFTHVIGPKNATTRLYLQWGTAVQLRKTFRAGLLIQIGLDNHI